MKRFACHCVVRMWDKGLKAETKAGPTITVYARNRSDAASRAKAEIWQSFTHPLREVRRVDVELVQSISA